MTEIFEKNGYTITLEPDQDASSPDQYGGSAAFIVTTRNRYFQVEGPNRETAETIGENLEEWAKTHNIYKLNALIHSGVHLSIASGLKEYYMGFDSGQIGFVLVTKDTSDIPEPFEFAKGLVEEWNMYLSGDVWYYRIEDENGETIDSLCGLYGFEFAKETALEAVPDSKGPVSTGA